MRIRAIWVSMSRVVTFILIASATSCGSDSTGTSGPVVSSVVVTGSRSNVEVGKTLQLSAIGLDANGFPVSGIDYHWSSSNTAVATVNNTGVVTGVALGAATISAFTGTIGGSKDITVGPVITTQLTEPTIPRG